jgi:hypothetical protein
MALCLVEPSHSRVNFTNARCIILKSIIIIIQYIIIIKTNGLVSDRFSSKTSRSRNKKSK